MELTWSYLAPLIFMAVMGLALLIYVVLDGYDIGVGILLPFALDDDKDVMISRQPNQPGANQRPADEIERLSRLFNLRGVQPQRAFRARELRPIGERHLHLISAKNSLKLAADRERGAQCFVTGDEFLQGAAQHIGLQRPAEMEQPALVVNARRRVAHLGRKPNLPLRFRQRREREGIRVGRVETDVTIAVARHRRGCLR